uniref:Dual specificity phosphatase, catalytic domain protein n=1 Tax=Mimiviridae sp. ChoanoV1 TaxID=2596887 RepID=A0A5B8IFQ5_9VIRU|nr:dual specificity phosphatase, catalytic domain protein [Mimiviridae sp. ChoanoV1]
MNLYFYLIYFIFEILKIKHYNEILPNLFIGNYYSINLQKYDLIVNCTKDLNDDFIKSKKIRIPINDNYLFKNNEILNYIHFLDIIDENLKNNKKVLVFCKFGFQRSATITLLYLILKKKLNKSEAIGLIKNQRTISFFLLNNFKHIIEKY